MNTANAVTARTVLFGVTAPPIPAASVLEIAVPVSSGLAISANDTVFVAPASGAFPPGLALSHSRIATANQVIIGIINLTAGPLPLGPFDFNVIVHRNTGSI